MLLIAVRSMTDIRELARQLSPIERKALKALQEKGWQNASELAQTSGLPIDSARRSMEWLGSKQLVENQTESQHETALTRLGKNALQKGLPEIQLLEWVSKNNAVTIPEAQQKSGVAENEFNIALGWNKKNNFLSINQGKISATGLAEENEFKIRIEERKKALQQLEKNQKIPETLENEFLQRGILEKKETGEKKIRLNENGSRVLELLPTISERSYNIHDPVPELIVGKKQPYVQFLNKIRRRLTELGFVEMDAPLITQEFYNFDVLFQPQNHPARSWTDTYQLKQPAKGKLPSVKTVQSIQAMHETGGVSASSGWQYSWEEEIAKRVMPAAHTTAHSARQLVKGINVPGKYFAIARCYRPDVVDATHLSEFNQMEGFVVGEELHFRHLLGMLKQFAEEFTGAKEVKFCPSYYPFTEPSVQLNAKHPKLGWIELGGAGMFRPEMLENLGIKGQALAWGLGIDRLAMFQLGIADIRQLFSEDLNWLRKQSLVVK